MLHYSFKQGLLPQPLIYITVLQVSVPVYNVYGMLYSHHRATSYLSIYCYLSDIINKPCPPAVLLLNHCELIWCAPFANKSLSFLVSSSIATAYKKMCLLIQLKGIWLMPNVSSSSVKFSEICCNELVLQVWQKCTVWTLGGNVY